MSTGALERALQHADVSRLARRILSRTAVDATIDEGMRLAAVTAVLRVFDDEPELLFIKRAERAGDPWSGHMALPGGRHEPGDVSLEMTAVRETREELSLDLSAGRMIGRLDDLAPRNPSLPPIIIRPFVALVAHDVTFAPNYEVAGTYWVPLRALRGDAGQAEHVMLINGVRARFPGYKVHEHVVWGLTERIVRQLLSLLDP